MKTIPIEIGTFESFTEGIEAAEVHGDRIDNVAKVLGQHIPFRDRAEAAAMRHEDGLAAPVQAIVASGAIRVAGEVGALDRDVSMVVFSRTGALALRVTRMGTIDNEALELISALDGGNLVLPVYAQT